MVKDKFYMNIWMVALFFLTGVLLLALAYESYILLADTLLLSGEIDILFLLAFMILSSSGMFLALVYGVYLVLCWQPIIWFTDTAVCYRHPLGQSIVLPYNAIKDIRIENQALIFKTSTPAALVEQGRGLVGVLLRHFHKKGHDPFRVSTLLCEWDTPNLLLELDAALTAHRERIKSTQQT